jgi:hypothetical protein
MTIRALVPPLRIILAVALAASPLAIAQIHPSIPGPVVPDGLGVNIHFTDPLDGEMELLAAAGFRWVRMDLGWAGIERERGVYDFAAFDRLVGHLEKHRLKALFILDYSNRLYEKDSSVHTEDGRRAFARWAAATAKRYQGRGYLWELWNEPNISFWKPKPDPAAYSALARATSAAIREAAPGEALIGPATSGFDFPFLDACFKEGVLDGWDAVSVHPYRQNEPETAVPEYAKLRREIRSYHKTGREIPVISGEWGYSAAWQHHDEDLQGRMLARQFLTNIAQRIPLSIWYDWRNDGPDPKEPEHHFGTVGLPVKVDGRTEFRIKPAYRAAKALSTTLNGHRFLRRMAFGETDDWALLFGNGQELVIACWTTSGEPRPIYFFNRNTPFRLIDHLGNERSNATGTDGVRGVTLSAAPCYLRFDRIHSELLKIPKMPAFTCDIIRVPGGVFLGMVENPAGEAFTGELRLTGIAGAKSVPLNLTAGETSKQVRFESAGDDSGTSKVGFEVLQGDRRIMTMPPRRNLLGDPQLLSRCVAKGDGDPKVASTQSITAAKEPPRLPGFTAPVSEITCKFPAGWRFATIAPTGDRAIPGRPQSFGIWVFGDGSGAGLRLRVRDANGRTWQPDGGTVTWHGWRHVRFPLSPRTAHWGGEGEDGIRYPLQWEAPVLIDNISRQNLETRLLVTAPTMVE